MSGLSKRITKLEQAVPDGPHTALVILHGEGFDPDSLTGVDGVDLPRLDDEEIGDYLARLAAHVRAERGRAGPMVTFAVYGPDDAPDAPPEQDTADMS